MLRRFHPFRSHARAHRGRADRPRARHRNRSPDARPVPPGAVSALNTAVAHARDAGVYPSPEETTVTVDDPQRTARAPQSGGGERARKKVLVSAMLGNVVEYYDFSLYGTLAVIISRQFFPESNATVGLLSTYAGVVLAYALRPLAGMVLGPLGDLKGRRFVLILTLAVMSIGTAGIGLMPTYAAIGIFAPILILFCRVLQAIGASVEYTTAANFIFEHDRGNRRNFLAGLSVASTSVGPLLSTLACYLVISLMPEQAFNTWGWRIPF